MMSLELVAAVGVFVFIAVLEIKRMQCRRRFAQRRPTLLTRAERKFVRTIDRALRISSRGLVILPQVRLADLVEPSALSPSLRTQRMTAIAYKTVDFVVCALKDGEYRPIVCIELNDNTHRRPDRMQRDVEVAFVCAEAGLPVAFIDIRHINHAQYVRRQVERAIDRCAASDGSGYVLRRLPAVPDSIMRDAVRKKLHVCPFVRQVDVIENPPPPRSDEWYKLAGRSTVALCDRRWRVVDVVDAY